MSLFRCLRQREELKVVSENSVELKRKKAKMYKFDEINYYADKFNLKEVISNLDLQHLDEAVYVCDLGKLAEKLELWQEHLPRVRPYYAVKCNDDVRVVETLAKLNTCFDCASKMELKLVLDYDVSPDRIIFANPCKPISHLEYAKERGVMTSTVDTEFEIYKIHKHYPESNLVIRFRCEAKEAQCPLGDKFGCDADNDATALILLAKSLNMNVTGLSFHVGSGCNDLEAYGRAIAKAASLFKFAKLLGYQMHLLDVGGGFPGDNDEKFVRTAAIINKTLQRHFKDEQVQIIAEPGRFFAAAAYTLVCKIHAKREVRGSDGKLSTNMYYINDGVYGSFNCTLYDHQIVKAEHVLDSNADGTLKTFDSLIWGPTCDALDKITEKVNLPNLTPGDYIVFRNMGAYTVPVASPFNGFLLPKVLYFKRQGQ